MTTTETFTGQIIDFANPELADISILDIAHSLSLQCRYNGHCPTHYSVAQHSVHVADLMEQTGYNQEWQFHGLMHDAHEAYIGDMITPLKMLPDLGAAFKKVDDTWTKIVANKYEIGMAKAKVHTVKQFDLILLATEARDFMPSKGKSWSHGVDEKFLGEQIIPWSAQDAKTEFLYRFEKLFCPSRW